MEDESILLQNKAVHPQTTFNMNPV
jgi:hypothetical protein